MTRGPLPKKAIAKAIDNGAIRGMLRDAAEMAESHHDFIIFGHACTTFIRVKRIQTHVTDPQEIAKKFDSDVLQIKRVPETPVVSRELWVLSPWGCWQYFRVLDDRIIEIQRDGVPVIPGVAAAGERPAPANPAPIVMETGSAVETLVTGSNCIPVMTGNESGLPRQGAGIINLLPAQEPPATNDPSTTWVSPATPVIEGKCQDSTTVTRG